VNKIYAKEKIEMKTKLVVLAFLMQFTGNTAFGSDLACNISEAKTRGVTGIELRYELEQVLNLGEQIKSITMGFMPDVSGYLLCTNVGRYAEKVRRMYRHLKNFEDLDIERNVDMAMSSCMGYSNNGVDVQKPNRSSIGQFVDLIQAQLKDKFNASH